MQEAIVLNDVFEVDEDERFNAEFNCGYDNCDGEIDIDYDPDNGGYTGICPKCGRIWRLVPASYNVESKPGKKQEEVTSGGPST